MTTTITAPDPRANERSHFGGGVVLDFTDGVAEYDGDLPEGVLMYMRQAGYGIDGPAAELPAPAEPLDPRDVETQLVGTDLRDAAVDPDPEVDFLPPVNAGHGNPHGPEVVSPTVHASGVKAVVPGPVGATGEDSDGKPIVKKDTAAQESKESDFAEATLVEQTPVPEATADAAKVDPINADAEQPENEAAANDTEGDPEGGGQFDPAEHSVAEVQAHLEQADDAERERVLAAERDGKNRKTLVSD